MVLYGRDKGRGYRLPLHAVPDETCEFEEYAMLTTSWRRGSEAQQEEAHEPIPPEGNLRLRERIPHHRCEMGSLFSTEDLRVTGRTEYYTNGYSHQQMCRYLRTRELSSR